MLQSNLHEWYEGYTVLSMMIIHLQQLLVSWFRKRRTPYIENRLARAHRENSNLQPFIHSFSWLNAICCKFATVTVDLTWTVYNLHKTNLIMSFAITYYQPLSSFCIQSNQSLFFFLFCIRFFSHILEFEKWFSPLWIASRRLISIYNLFLLI